MCIDMFVFFPESEVLLCDFHREKAWVRWIKRKDNGCHEEVLPLLWSIAESPTEEEFAQRCLMLQQTKVWQENEKLRRWFLKKWLPQSKRWVHVFRDESLKVVVYTNNGAERQNEFLKHSNLMGYKNCSLTELLTVIVTDFLPRSYKTYIELNVKWSGEYQKIQWETAFVPERQALCCGWPHHGSPSSGYVLQPRRCHSARGWSFQHEEPDCRISQDMFWLPHNNALVHMWRLAEEPPALQALLRCFLHGTGVELGEFRSHISG